MSDKRDIVYRYGQEGLEDLQRKLLEMAGAAQQAAKQIGEGSKPASSGLKAIDEAGRQAKAVVEDLAAKAGPAGAILSRLGPAGITAAAGIAAVGGGLVTMLHAAANAELEVKKIEAVIRATGGASGVTARQVEDLAKSLSRTSIVAESELKAAATQLLTFKGIAGETFGETLRVATDVAALGFTNVTSATLALAKALEDPAAGMEALKRIGVDLTATESARIQQLQEMNRLQEAQNELLHAAASHVGGAGAASADTLIGSYHRATEAAKGYVDAVATNIVHLQQFKDLSSGIAAFFDKQAERWSPEGQIARREAALTAINPHHPQAKQYREEIEALQLLIKARAQEEAAAARLAKRQQEEAQRHEWNRRAIEAAEKEVTAHLETLKKKQKADKDYEAWREDGVRALAKLNEEQYQDALGTVQRIQEGVEKAIASNDTSLMKAALGIATPSQVQETFDAWDRIAAQMKSVSDEAARDMYNVHRDMWDDVLAGNLKSFDGWADAIGGIYRRKIASQLAMEGDAWFKNLFGGQGGEIMGHLGAGLAGYQMGSSLGNARSGPGNEIGGAIGGAAGSYFGPVGTYVGSAIGSLIGGQFGPRPSDRTETVTRELFTGRRWENDLGAGKDSPENRAAVDALDDAIMLFIDTMKGFGLNAGASSYMLEVGAGNSQSPFRASVSGGAVKDFETRDAAFNWIAGQMVDSLSVVPEKLQTIVDNFDPSKVEQFFNDLQRFQNFDRTLEGIRDEILKITDPRAWDIKQVTDWFAAIQTEAVDLGYDITSAIFDPVIALRDRQLADIAANYAPASVTPVTPEIAQLQATANWMSIIGGLYDQRIEQLEDEAAALRASSQAWDRLGAMLRNTRSSLLLDPSLSPLSLEQRRAEAFSQLDHAYASAQGGNQDAAAQLPDLARAALTASKEFYRSSEDYYRDFDRVQGMLGAAESYAAQEVSLAQEQLVTQQAMLAALQAGRGALEGTPASYNAADVAEISSAFGVAWQRSGLSRSDFLQTDEGRNVWLPLRDRWIGGIDDKAQLEASLAAARAQKNEGGYASSDAMLFERQIVDRMNALGYDVPVMHAGGMVRRTGLAYLEKGEHVTPRSSVSGLETRLAAVESTIGGLPRLIAEVGKRTIEHLAAISQTNETMAQSEAVAARAARGGPRGKVARATS